MSEHKLSPKFSTLWQLAAEVIEILKVLPLISASFALISNGFINMHAIFRLDNLLTK